MPETLKLLKAVVVAEAAIAKFLNVNIPALAMDEPSAIVIVPADGAKVLRASTVNAPATENELVG